MIMSTFNSYFVRLLVLIYPGKVSIGQKAFFAQKLKGVHHENAQNYEFWRGGGQ